MGPGVRWNFENCRTGIRSLKGRRGFPDTEIISFLRLNISTVAGVVTDELGTGHTPVNSEIVFCILDWYSRAPDVVETFSPVPFRQLPGGVAYDSAFRKRAADPLAVAFGQDRRGFSEAMRELDAIPVAMADFAWKLYALPRVPVYILIHDNAPEFPQAASLLFDSSVASCLPTEAVAMLGELTAERILSAIRGHRSPAPREQDPDNNSNPPGK